MTRGINEGYFLIMTGYVEGTDLLSYSSYFTFSDMGFSEEINEGGLAMIDMTHDCDNWWLLLHFVHDIFIIEIHFPTVDDTE